MTSAALLTLLVAATPLKAGDKAPDFTLADQNGKPVTLSKALEGGPVILAFYPKAFTSGCTKQNVNLREHFSELTGKGAQVFGVSTDDVKTQREFHASLKLPYPLLSDPGGKVSAQYAGKMPVFGVASRANFVIGQDGVVVEVIEGGDAVDAGPTVAACPARKPKS